MPIVVQDNFSTAASKPTDARYGPYNNTSAAIAAIPEAYRYIGLTVGVGSPIEEYWWANGTTDGDLIEKTTLGNVTSISEGTGILVDNTNPQTPIVSIDTDVVQVVSNLSTDTTLGGVSSSDVLYPSQLAVKTYTDGLVVGLLNDRGNWPGGAVSPGAYPSTNGSGPAGAIMKGDIWFINVAGYLGTTAVSIGASVRALVNSPASSTDWDILDAGLGFIPEDSANKVLSGASVNADPTSTVKYPSVKALVEYVTTYSPTPTIPNLQAVTTGVGANITTNEIKIDGNNLSIKAPSNSRYFSLYCQTISGNGAFSIKDSPGFERFRINRATDNLIYYNSTQAAQTLSFSGNITQTYTFPNASGTLALLDDLSPFLTSALAASTYVPNTRTLTINGVSYDLSANRSWTIDTLPSQTGNNGKWLKTNGSTASWQTLSGNVSSFTNDAGYITSSVISGTINYIPKFTASGTIGDSLMNYSGGLYPSGNPNTLSLESNNTGLGPTLNFSNTGSVSPRGTNYTSLYAFGTTFNIFYSATKLASFELANLTASQTYTLPNDSGILALNKTTNYILKSTTTGTADSLIYDNGTNVGIGTTSPTDILHIRTTGGNLNQIRQTSISGSLQVDFLSCAESYGSGQGSVGTASNHGLFLRTNNTPRVRISKDGNLFIGNSFPTYPTTNDLVWIKGSTYVEDKLSSNSLSVGTTSVNASAIVDISSTSKGFLPPRMNYSQRTGISSPAEGLIVYQNNTSGTSYKGAYLYNGSSWQLITLPYKKYVAIIEVDSSNSLATQTVLENELGGSVTITYNSTAKYVTFTSSGLFTAGKTGIFTTPGASKGDVTETVYAGYIYTSILDSSNIQLAKINASGVLSDRYYTMVEIRVYN